MPLRVRDTLTARLRTVGPTRGRPTTMYVCGPTVYDRAHVGHARTYLYFDVARRALEAMGGRVRHVENITDFEDKITARAAALGVPWRTLARREMVAFRRDMDALGLRPPHVAPRASAFVPAMAALVRRLDRRRLLERRDDGWYFRGDTLPVGERNFALGLTLARHAVAEPGVEPPGADRMTPEFLVWRPQSPPLPSWPGPLGRGMPGWHLECFVMAERHLGLPVDLHGGGLDLVFPHHFAENQLAETFYGTPFARTFLHTAFVTGNGRKMSKSVGNLVRLRLALDDVGADALKWYLLTPAYHQPLPWRAVDLERARTEFHVVADRFRGAVGPGAGGSLPEGVFRDLARVVLGRVADGFRVDEALDRIRSLADRIGRHPSGRLPRGARPRARRALADLERLLGVRFV